MRKSISKIKSRVKLIKIIKHLKSYGKKIVFTNGCFDILHPGHIKVFERAGSLGDVLVVGINTDDSIRRLKGRTRPIQDEKSRALIVAAIESVDYVTLFDEDTPLNLIRSIKPDVLVKGGDYTEEKIVGREYAQKIVRVPLAKGFSTTSIINKIIKNTSLSFPSRG